MLRGQIRRLDAEVGALRFKNDEQLSAYSELQNELDHVRRTQVQLAAASADVVVALYDGGGVVTLDKLGNVVGLGSLPPAHQDLLQGALKTGRAPTPKVVAELVVRHEAMMGKRDPLPFRLFSPVGTVVQSDRPTFRWTPLAGASSYKVTVSDSNFEPVLVSEDLSATEWTVPRPLARGMIYSWEVTAMKDREEITVPRPPADQARFRVLESGKVEELHEAKRTNPNAHLLLGVLYSSSGLLDDAEREFQSLAASNPHSTIPQKLLRNLKSLRAGKVNNKP